MVANILPADPRFYPQTSDSIPTRGVKIQLFQNMVMLHIKLKGMVKKTECDHVSYQIKGKEE